MNRRKAIELTGVSFALLATGCANRTPLAPLKSVTVLPVANVDQHVLDTRDINTKTEVDTGLYGNELSPIFVEI